MGSFSIWHLLVILVVVMVLFGAGKIPRLMGDMAKGVKAFKEGMKDINDSGKADAADQATPTAAQQVDKKDPAKV